MGKPFASEIEKVEQTYRWAREIELGPLMNFISCSSTSSMISIGSGGSFTAATMASLLHQATGHLSKALTPLELEYQKDIIHNSNILMLSAGGRNPDILTAFRLAIRKEPKNICTVTLKQNNPIYELSNKYGYTFNLALEAPFGKDGYLATNSLLSFLTILTRAYSECGLVDSKMPSTISPENSFIRTISDNIDENYGKGNWMVLYGGWGLPVAIDIESKFTESALGCVLVSDYRNFAHGRHNWIAKKEKETNIIALATPEEIPLARKTISMLPNDVNIINIESKCSGPAGSLELLIKTFYLENILGLKIGIDPGRPNVMDFGRKIYNFKYSHDIKGERHSGRLNTNVALAISRKNNIPNVENLSAEELRYWKSAYWKFIKKINAVRFGSLILDYDGTLCGTSERYNSITKDMASNIEHILRNNVPIGIATGRGKSVKEVLRNTISEEYWDLLTVGYYNCSIIAKLTEDNCPLKDGKMHPSLVPIDTILLQNKLLLRQCLVESRPNQISIVPGRGTSIERIRGYLSDLIMTDDSFNRVKIFESGHSIDICPIHASKLNLLGFLNGGPQEKKSESATLCIGDRGKWPGNDYELLSSEYSLSVDTVSSNPSSCWNLVAPGLRGVDATCYYFERMKPSENALTIKVD